MVAGDSADISQLKKVLIVPASTILFSLCVIFYPHDARADFELVPTLQVEHAGIIMKDDPTGLLPIPVVDGSQLSGVNGDWIFTFLEPWHESVPEGLSVFAILRGSFETPESELVVEENFDFETIAISGEENEVRNITFRMPQLGDPSVPSGRYTVIVAQLPLKKYVYNPDTELLEESDYTFTDFKNWLEGGFEATNTFSPDSYRFLEFDYIQSEISCCSNVLFLPGLEASRLYREVDGEEKRLWLPPIISDNDQLLLNPDGSSTVNGIYTRDLLDETFGANIYKSFIDRMDNMVEDEVISEWKAFPYDWRFNVNTIVQNPTALRDTTISLVEEVERLAANSKSGKVTLVSHSNGGLVGKALLLELDRQGKSGLIDTFIMVGVPQLGTPKAIMTLLHGEGLPFNWFPFLITKEELRTIGENMPSGYALLPSGKYFDLVGDPVIEFESSPSTQAYINKYGLEINSETELQDFILGAEGRAKPTTNNLFTPNVGNSTLLTNAIILHENLDNWTAPLGVEVIQVAGWGVPTIKGIKYKERKLSGSLCAIQNCTILDHEPIFTVDGDETVVVPSASDLDGDNNYYFDIRSYNDTNNKNVKHYNIFESKSVLDLIQNIVQKGQEDLPAYISSGSEAPTSAGLPALRLSVHSPVTLDLYDLSGRHTGVIDNTSQGVSLIEEEIPNSYYLEIGEGKYAGIISGENASIKLYGKGNGTFTLKIQETQGDSVTESTTFGDIPVTQDSIATLNVSNSGDIENLKMDIDGNGIDDVSITPGIGLTTEELLSLIKNMIPTLNLDQKKKDRFIKRIDKFIKILEKEYKKELKKKQKIKDILNKLHQLIKDYEKKKLLTAEEVVELRNLLEMIQNTNTI